MVKAKVKKSLSEALTKKKKYVKIIHLEDKLAGQLYFVSLF